MSNDSSDITRQAETGSAAEPVRGVVLGWLRGFSEEGIPLVDLSGGDVPALLPARATSAVGEGQVGRQVALMFEDGDREKPVIMGVIETPPPLRTPDGEVAGGMPLPLTVNVDRKRIVLKAEHEIVLQCGPATITMDRTGKIVIKGERLLSRARGSHRIKGGSVQIN